MPSEGRLAVKYRAADLTVVQRLYVAGIAGEVIAAIVLLLLAASPKKDYDLRVSASITEEGAGRRMRGIYTATRVSIENTGKMPLTNVSLSYTSTEDRYTSDYAERIEPGSKAYFYPEFAGYPQYVTVTADNGVSATSKFSLR